MIYISIMINEAKVKVLGREVKKLIFHHAILIQDIFHENTLEHLRFGKLIDKVHMEGTVSQIF